MRFLGLYIKVSSNGLSVDAYDIFIQWTKKWREYLTLLLGINKPLPPPPRIHNLPFLMWLYYVLFLTSPHRGGAWSSRGCWLAFSNHSHSICQCSHLSNFAVLMDLSSDEVRGSKLNFTILIKDLGNIKINSNMFLVLQFVLAWIKIRD